MRRKIIDLARFIRALGTRAGALAYLNLHRSSNGVAEIRLPFLPSRVRARRGTVDVDVFDQIFVMRHYDIRSCSQWPVLYKKYEQICAQGRRPLIIDCGANIGLSALYLEHLFPRAAVVAIEPDIDNMQMLRTNVAGHPNVIPVLGAISDHPGMVSITNPDAHPWAFQVAEAQTRNDSTIPAMTVDDVCGLVPDGELFIVKIDIEGGEEQLFRSNVDWVSRSPMISIELHDWMRPWGGSSRSFFQAVQGMDFDFVLAGENAFVFNWSACHEQPASSRTGSAAIS